MCIRTGIHQAVYSTYIETVENAFLRARAPIQWDYYFAAINERHSSHFRGPDFLSISPARSATTWLFDQVRRNDSVYVPRIKETNYFTSQWMDGPYERYFADWQPQQLAGDISPNYALLPRRAVAEIHRAFPATRLICILRNPVERVWSHVLFDLLRRGGSFQISHAELSALPEQLLLTLVAGYSSLNRYADLLERWLEYYPADQFYIDYFESVSLCPSALLTRIYRFLGAPDRASVKSGKVNALQYGSIAMPARVREFLHDFYAPELEALNSLLKKRFGLGIPESWHLNLAQGTSRIKLADRYRGLGLCFHRSQFQAVPDGSADVENCKALRCFFEQLVSAGSNFEGSSNITEELLERLMAWLCEIRAEASGPILLSSCRGHNLVAFRKRVYALPHSLGVWDRWQTDDPELVPGVLAGSSVDEVLSRLEEGESVAD